MTESGAQTGRRGRRVWPWVLAVIVLLLLLTIATIVVVIVAAPNISSNGGEQANGTHWDEQYISGQGNDKVVVLPVVGTIASSTPSGILSSTTATPETLQSQLDQASDDNDVKAVILEVNSPGGGVVASSEMHDAITDFKRSTGIPVVVSMQDVAASGGYYVSAPADRIVANKSTFTGSIGVIIEFLNYSKASKKYGIGQVDITSGKFKDIGSPWKKVSPADRKIFQSIVDDSYNQFVGVVAKGRHMPESKVRKIADGRIYSGLQAKKIGLVDDLGNMDTAVSDAKNLANVDHARVVRYVQPPSLFQSLQARLAPQPPQAVQIMQAAGLDPTPKLQYLYRPGM